MIIGHSAIRIWQRHRKLEDADCAPTTTPVSEMTAVGEMKYELNETAERTSMESPHGEIHPLEEKDPKVSH